MQYRECLPSAWLVSSLSHVFIHLVVPYSWICLYWQNQWSTNFARLVSDSTEFSCRIGLVWQSWFAYDLNLSKYICWFGTIIYNILTNWLVEISCFISLHYCSPKGASLPAKGGRSLTSRSRPIGSGSADWFFRCRSTSLLSLNQSISRTSRNSCSK